MTSTGDHVSDRAFGWHEQFATDAIQVIDGDGWTLPAGDVIAWAKQRWTYPDHGIAPLPL